MSIDYKDIKLKSPLLITIAKDSYLTPITPFADKTHIPNISSPKYGQDISFGYGRDAPKGQSVGNTPEELKPKMEALLGIFAKGDKTGMAKRLFSNFLELSCRQVTYFDDEALNRVAKGHAHINFFCDAVVSSPNSPHKKPGFFRIHQSLKQAGWDITKMIMPTGIGVPAFNKGSKLRNTEDFNNGLGLMINGIQYVYIIATHYSYNSQQKKYHLGLKFIFYDVFGLDDDDLNEYGASSDSLFSSNAAIGITAWWQLQHQHGLAPLVTRIVLDKYYESPAI